ncbi:MAG TPA: helix-hairpin-helix domain-containing protein [Chitinophagaceae bacterium]|nr:helix-hairpin-helix domain-containing protein [Chitinophagaceae bacterium]
MNRKDFIKDYLQFTYKERIAIIALVALIIVLVILPHLFPGASAADTIKSDTSWMAAAGKLLEKKPDTVFYYRRDYAGSKENREFYRQHGYVRYANKYPYRDSFPRQSFYKRAVRKIENVEINSADSTAWEALPGIGPVLAARIIKFRDKLGGFYMVEQVKEVYGLQDSTFQLIKPYLKVNVAQVHKINVNTATKEELKMHPYIRWQLGGMIADYRTQHGNFASLDDLKNLQQVTDEVFEKIAPYLSL